jgi:hypothetical protein
MVSINDFFSDTQPDIQKVDLDADNETLYGAGVDMTGYEGVAFFLTVSKGEAANFTLKAQQDTASGFGTAADLAGTAKTVAIATATDGFGFIDIKNPQERYVRPAIVCPNVGTPRAISCVSIRYGKQYLPETNADGELHVAPAEGTA